MNNLPLLFDTGALIALFNKREEKRAEKILEFIDKHPHSPRLAFEPCLVELFYKLVKKEKLMTPNDVEKNFDHLAISFAQVPAAQSKQYISAYTSFTDKIGFDYADFYLSAAAFRYTGSQVLTVDQRDLPNAMAAAARAFPELANNFPQIIPF